MILLGIILAIVLGTMAVCYVLSLQAKADGDEGRYMVFAQAFRKIYYRIVLCLVVVLFICFLGSILGH